MSERSRIVKALREQHEELKELLETLGMLKINENDEILQIIADYGSLRGRILKFEPEAKSYCSVIKLGTPWNDAQVQQWLTTHGVHEISRADYYDDIDLLIKIKDVFEKRSTDREKQNARSFLKHLLKMWKDRFEHDWIPILESSLPPRDLRSISFLQILDSIDSSLLPLYEGALEALKRKDADAPRQSISSTRELLDHVLRKIEPGKMKRIDRIRRIMGSETDTELGEAISQLGVTLYQAQSKRVKTKASYEEAVFLLEITTSFIIFLSQHHKIN